MKPFMRSVLIHRVGLSTRYTRQTIPITNPRMICMTFHISTSPLMWLHIIMDEVEGLLRRPVGPTQHDPMLVPVDEWTD